MQIKFVATSLSLIYIISSYIYRGFEFALFVFVLCAFLVVPIFFPWLNRWVPAPWIGKDKSYYGINLRSFYNYLHLFLLFLPLVFLLYLLIKNYL